MVIGVWVSPPYKRPHRGNLKDAAVPCAQATVTGAEASELLPLAASMVLV
jgi:hypothetical protein